MMMNRAAAIVRALRDRKILAVTARAAVAMTVAAVAIWTGLQLPGANEDDFQPDITFNLALGGPSQPWSSVASDGTIDTDDLDLARVSGAVVQLANSAPNNATLNVRYNITAVEGVTNNLGCILIIARFRDPNDQTQVLAKLKRYNISTGELRTLLTVNINNFPDSNEFQLGNEFDCSLAFDFFSFAYFVDVELIKDGSNGKPALGSLRISSFAQ